MTDKTQAILPVTQADRDFAILACRLTGWEGVAQRLEQGWEPDADTNEGKLVEAAARHRQSHSLTPSPCPGTGSAEGLTKSIEEWTLPECRDDSDDILRQLTGRARYLRDRGEVKTPELLEQAHRMLAAIYGWREYDWPEGFCRRTADLIAENAERLAALTPSPCSGDGMRSALGTILALIGNVDHSRGHGPNAAEMRGGMLNDIRDVATAALTPSALSGDAGEGE